MMKGNGNNNNNNNNNTNDNNTTNNNSSNLPEDPRCVKTYEYIHTSMYYMI